MITGDINVNKIDKNYLRKVGNAVYLDLVLIETPDSKFGQDYMVVQGIPKSEREAGKKGAILGNFKIFIKEDVELTDDDKDDLPF